jgi:CysZ protein
MFPLPLTLRTLTRADLLGLMIACAFLALLVVAAMVASITWAAGYWIHIEAGWLDTALTWLIGIVSGVGGWFMLPALMVLIGGVFQEKVIQRVERRFYPQFSHPGEARFWPDLYYDLKFTLKAIGLNLMVLPLYLLGIGFFVSIALNTYLLGHEFFESVAGHHYGKAKARQLSRRHRGSVYAGGLVITLVSLVPVANLFVPIIAVVWMTHVFHGCGGHSSKAL